MEIKKVIIPVAGLGTRFLPLSKVLRKELLPLVDKPIIQYGVEEAKASGIKEIIFVVSSQKKEILSYFEKSPELERITKFRKRDYLISELKKIDSLTKGLSFSSVFQKFALGDGQAILLTEKIIGNQAAAVLFPDDIVDSKTPCLSQLFKIFKTSQKPIIALKKLPKERLPSYGVVDVEKITGRLYKIKGIIEKPKDASLAPSNLVIVGRYIITPEVFDYLKKTPKNGTREVILANAFQAMIKDNKAIYGYEFEGEWLECGDKLQWLKSNLYFSLKHSKFAPELKKYLKKIC